MSEKQVLNGLLSDVTRRTSCPVEVDCKLFPFIVRKSEKVPVGRSEQIICGTPVNGDFVSHLSLFLSALETRRFVGNFPEKLRTLYERVFSGDGSLRDYPDVLSIHCIYQVLSLLLKFGSSEITDSMRQAAIAKYRDDDMDPQVRLDDEILDVSRDIIHEVVEGFLFPKRGYHGPGAVAEPGNRGRRGSKYALLDRDFLNRFFVLPSGVEESLHAKTGYTSRLCFVPKTRDKCRIICAEPASLQFVQQGFDRALRHSMLSNRLHRIDLSDQLVNAAVALESSSHGYYATIDLSSASDRLMAELVGRLFPWELAAKLLACRSTATQLPSGEVLHLRKFGSMGNATTFSVESLIFWALAVATRVCSGERLKHAVHDTWSYGDDIIVPSSCAVAVMQTLVDAGCKVNVDKSFWRGGFRESCGIHAFNGLDITPGYLRTWGSSSLDLASMVGCAHVLSKHGFTAAAEPIYLHVEQVLKKALPYSKTGDGFARYLGPDECIHASNWRRGFETRVNGFGEVFVRSHKLGSLPRDRIADEYSTSTLALWHAMRPAEFDRGFIHGRPKLITSWVRVE